MWEKTHQQFEQNFGSLKLIIPLITKTEAGLDAAFLFTTCTFYLLGLNTAVTLKCTLLGDLGGIL